MPLDAGIDTPLDAGLEQPPRSGTGTPLPVVLTIPLIVPASANITSLGTAAFTFTENGNTFGPFSAPAVVNSDGSYSLTALLSSVPTGLVSGKLYFTIGDWPDQSNPGSFAAVSPPISPQITGDIAISTSGLTGEPLTRLNAGTADLLIYQGETEYYLAVPVDTLLSVNVVSAAAVIRSPWSDLHAPASGQAMVITSNVLPGGVPYVAFILPAGWANETITPGNWQISASLRLRDGSVAVTDILDFVVVAQ